MWWFSFILAVAIAMYLLRAILIPFFVAGAFSYLLRPVMKWLVHCMGLPRWMAILIIYIILFAILGGFVMLAGPTIKDETLRFVNNLPGILHRLVGKAFGGDRIQFLGESITVNHAVQKVVENIRGSLGPLGILKPAILVAEVLAGFFLSMALLLFMLIGGEEMKRGVLNLFPRSRHAQLLFFAVKIDHVLGRYVRGLALIVAYAGLSAWIGLGLIIKAPYAAPISLLTGVMELVPIVGPVTSFLLSSAAGFLSGGLLKMIEAIGVYGTMRLTTDNLVAPLVLGRAVYLNPIVVLFAFLAGGTLFGILGLLLAIPIAASLRVIIKNWKNAPTVQR
jgi:predicted PurR-regulated permease PerM